MRRRDQPRGLPPVPAQVCNALLQTLDFGGMPLDSALRRMIALIRLPGEAQKIDRIIEQFAINFVEANPIALDHVDTAQVQSHSNLIAIT